MLTSSLAFNETKAAGHRVVAANATHSTSPEREEYK